MRSERKRGEACKPNPPIWPVEELLKCLSESEALLGLGGTPWVKEYGRSRGGLCPPRPGWRQGLATKHTCNNTLKGEKKGGSSVSVKHLEKEGTGRKRCFTVVVRRW